MCPQPCHFGTWVLVFLKSLLSDCLVPVSVSPPGVSVLGGHVWVSDYTRPCQVGTQACTW